ncbi:MAG: ribosomal protein S18P -alanine acetyltransferase [Nocardioidaceae bacterium]|nr:ribosomal protein S18P -alanine acetyltransferase [Nocardioidaceae bacterium]
MIRPATTADVPALLALEAAAFGADAWSEELVRARVEQTLVAESLGSATVTVAGDLADLERIAVHPDHRRSGLGRDLLAAAVRRAADAGAGRILLEVRDDNVAARAFYAATGFTEIDRRRGYYRDGTDALVLELTVDGR